MSFYKSHRTVFVRKSGQPVNWFNIQTQCAVFVTLLFFLIFNDSIPTKKRKGFHDYM